jgi:hypothetical protein
VCNMIIEQLRDQRVVLVNQVHTVQVDMTNRFNNIPLLKKCMNILLSEKNSTNNSSFKRWMNHCSCAGPYFCCILFGQCDQIMTSCTLF